MTSDNQSSKSDNIFVQYRKSLISVLILVGSIGFFTGEEKSIEKEETVPGACLILRSYESSGVKRGAGKFLRKEDCQLDYEKIQNPEKFLKKTNSTNYVLSRDLVAEGQSRLVRFFSFGIFAALATAVFLTLRAKGFLKERILDVKKSFRIKLESGKSTVNVRKAGLSTEEEVKWLSKRYTWKYIPNRYQALVACIVSGFLYFNIFNVLFSDRSTGDCGSFFRPKLDEEPYALGWIWDTIGSNNVKCSDAYYGGLLWEFYLTFAALAICGLVLRRAIKRENAAKSA